MIEGSKGASEVEGVAMRCLLLAAVFLIVSAKSEAQAQAFRTIRIPKTLNSAASLQHLVPKHKARLVSAKVETGAPESILGFIVPTQVSLEQSDHLHVLGIKVPGTAMKLDANVQCNVVVFYAVSGVELRENELHFPEPTVIPYFAVPPGERGAYRYKGSNLRTNFLPWDTNAIEEMKTRVPEYALQRARSKVLGELRQHEAAFFEGLRTEVEELASAHPWGIIMAALVVAVIAGFCYWRKYYLPSCAVAVLAIALSGCGPQGGGKLVCAVDCCDGPVIKLENSTR